MADDPDRVVVRMYRGVLGDCFLLTVWTGGTPKVAMIDCGVLQNVRPGPEMVTNLPAEVVAGVGADALAKVEATKDAVRSIEADIVAYLADKGGKLDLLVITHDHYDHVAGFTLPDDENVFMQPSFGIDRLWLSWVEDPADKQAKELGARFAKGKEAVALAAEVGRRLARRRPPSDALQQVQALAAFIGPVASPGLPAVTSKTKTTTQSIQAMREKVGSNTRFLEPGQVIDGEEGIGLKAYVLAPPRKEKRLFKDSPTGKGEAKEVYLTDVDEASAVAGAALSKLHGMQMRADLAADGGQAVPIEDEMLDPLPFAKPHERPYPVKDKKAPKREALGWRRAARRL